MDNFFNNFIQTEDDEKNYQDPSLTLYNPFLLNNQSTQGFDPSQVNMSNITPELLFNMSMRGGNVHSALFNQPTKPILSQMDMGMGAIQDPFQQQGMDQAIFTKSMGVPMQMSVLQQQAQPQFQGFNQSQVQVPVQPPKLFNQKASTHGIYSSSGFDLLSILVYIANRPNPVVNIGPVDLSCAFLLSDARQPDFPIVYVSPTFESLTGYTSPEILGRNCRFLQAPDGRVVEGSRRKFSDNNQVYMFKAKIMAVQEHQACLVNYKKNGQAFFNLVTIIPIFEGGSVNYFVGLQVDMVDQPNAIIDNMKNTAFSINYGKPTFTKALTDINSFEDLPSTIPYENLASIFDDNTSPSSNDSNRSEANYREWIKHILDKCDDFIYVLSLKGTFLYASPAAKKVLGYDPEDLIGQNLSKICHSGDLVPTLRELKEIGNENDSIELTFRFKPKYNDHYLWMESTGKLHGDMGKGRRCIVLTGRLRQMFELSYESILETGGEITANDLFIKFSPDGIILYASSNITEVLGYDKKEIVGTSLYQMIPPERAHVLTSVLEQAYNGNANKIYHHIQTKKGNFLKTLTSFFPGNKFSEGEKAEFILTRLNVSTTSTSSDLEANYKAEPLLSNPFQGNENVFAFESNSQSSWQYELHQLRLKNRKLKEQISQLDPIANSKKKRNMSKKLKTCMTCNRSSTTEWRRGPKGPSTLCNPCGLKYSKGLAPFNKTVNDSSSTNDSGSNSAVETTQNN